MPEAPGVLRATGRDLDAQAMRAAHRGDQEGAMVLLSAAMAYACAADSVETLLRIDARYAAMQLGTNSSRIRA